MAVSKSTRQLDVVAYWYAYSVGISIWKPGQSRNDGFSPIFVNLDPGISYRIITVLCNHQDYSAM